jgi:hypothetical protein
MITQEIFDLAFEIAKRYVDDEVSALNVRIAKLEQRAEAEFQRGVAEATRQRGNDAQCTGPH